MIRLTPRQIGFWCTVNLNSFSSFVEKIFNEEMKIQTFKILLGAGGFEFESHVGQIEHSVTEGSPPL